MNNVLLALVVGLLAGVVGSYAVHTFTSAPSADPIDGAPADLSTLDARLARIEAALDRDEPMTLRGTPGGGLAPEDREAVAMAVARQLDAQMKDSVREGVKAAWQDLGEPASAASEVPGIQRRAKKNASLSEAAAELGLSSTEENDLRQIYTDTIDKAIGLLAGEDGDRDEVRRDFERIKQDPNARMGMLGKYMPKIMPNIGEFMSLQADREGRIREAIGDEKAQRLNNDFDIEEADPFGFSGNLRFEARGGARGR
jgi:hypothetical protein